MVYLLDWVVAILTIMYAGILLAYRYWFGKMRLYQLSQSNQANTQFTVIIPARNEAANIKTCVESVLAQDYPADAFEIIVIDDFSDDDRLLLFRL